MSRRVKCKNCIESGGFAIPMRVTKDNYDYAKHVLLRIKQIIYCKELGKTKQMENEQYCKYYHKAPFPYSNERDVEALEKMIADYEVDIEKE